MICINSRSEQTKVINSRAHKKLPIVWRRRQGVDSKTVFTTYERPSLADHTVTQPDGTTTEFNLGKLIISIAGAFTHNPHAASYDSLHLAYTIEATLAMHIDTHLLPKDIAQATHTVLKRFDELAAMQYGAQHHLITSVRKRGRPSIRESA